MQSQLVAATSGTGAKPCSLAPAVLADGSVVVRDCEGKVVKSEAATVPTMPENKLASHAGLDRLSSERDDYLVWSLKHSRRLYIWQFASSIAIFFLVVGLVVVGVYFAALQFFQAMKHPLPASSTQADTEIVASLKEFKVKSSVLGVVILTLSMAFFYLYLSQVYPIKNDVEPTRAQESH
ncbi:MAG TPA: hypothetical protein VFA68_21700 [Terriglobales bacterium]|nr:hypothetical protein [Terriglobales bacterium]